MINKLAIAIDNRLVGFLRELMHRRGAVLVGDLRTGSWRRQARRVAEPSATTCRQARGRSCDGLERRSGATDALGEGGPPFN
jgi:hypothetical protein